MKIYRFVPNTKNYRHISTSPLSQWWPDGMDWDDLASSMFPRVREGVPWSHSGNKFKANSKALPISDFPALSLNIPVLSAKAYSSLRHLKGIKKTINITIDGTIFHAVQPQVILGAINDKKSLKVCAPAFDPLFENDVFLYLSRHFNEEKINLDIFWLNEPRPAVNKISPTALGFEVMNFVTLLR